MKEEEEESILDKIAPAPLKQFDAFPKVPSTYQSQTDGRGFLTVLIGLLCFTLILNDIGEFIWGWPDYQFGMDREVSSFMKVNLDMIVHMPCRFLSVDLRDSTGDRIHLSSGFSRDGTNFDVLQARKMQQYAWDQMFKQRRGRPVMRNNMGFFGTLFRKTKAVLKPKYDHKAEDTACRIHGSVPVKKVTANLHITTLGHGYASPVHVSHEFMNLTHVISEFSFGPYFPDIVQPLDNTFAMTFSPFTAYQYFLTVVPTKYVPARSSPVRTNQYSVTNYVKTLQHGQGTPGIFFKFDLDPIAITVQEKTTTFTQFLIRCVGVVGGVWVCMGWAVRVSYKAVEVVTGVKEGEQEIVAVEVSGAKKRWGGGELKRRVVKQGNGWVVEGSNDWSGMGSPSLSAGGYYSPSIPGTPHAVPLPVSAGPGSPFMHSPRLSQTFTTPPTQYSTLGPTPSGLPHSPLPGAGGFEQQQHQPGSTPPRRRDSQGSNSLSDVDRAFKDR